MQSRVSGECAEGGRKTVNKSNQIINNAMPSQII